MLALVTNVFHMSVWLFLNSDDRKASGLIKQVDLLGTWMDQSAM